MKYRLTDGVKIEELSNKEKVVDPVCKMEIKEGVIKTDYKGKTYSFCSEYCRIKFTREPSSYVGS